MSVISRFKRAITAPAEPNSLQEDAVLWSYRLLLGREPESAEALRLHANAHGSVDEIRRFFLQSDEFTRGAGVAGTRVLNSEVLKHFPPWTGAGEPGSWRDFLGVKTRCEYLPKVYDMLSGTVEGPPGTEKLGIHEVAEWVGTLRSVLEARERGELIVVELGAGWGPWLVGAAKAAEHVGITRVRLAGVEGAGGHVAFMHQHFRDNGLDPDAHLLIHGVVGARDGIARFPRSGGSRSDYGSKADYDNGLPAEDQFEEVRCVALTTLLGQLPPVDLIHCDVQGAEVEVLMAARAALEARVRRVVVGTHSRRIEADLLDLFSAMGWRIEDEKVCGIAQSGGGFGLTSDGYQIWANARPIQS